MKNTFLFIWIIVMLVAFSFPSISFSATQEVVGQYCDVYTGDMKNKTALDDFKKSVNEQARKDAFKKIVKAARLTNVTSDCINYAASHYVDKVTILSHTERTENKGRRICEKVKMTYDSESVRKYLSQEFCLQGWNANEEKVLWCYDVDTALESKEGKLNVGVIIEAQMANIDPGKKDLLEQEEEKQFLEMTQINKGKYQVLDRNAFMKAAEQQKMSLYGITDNDILKLGKLLNLDVVVHRIINDNDRTTKVRKISTGKVLLAKTYETESEAPAVATDWIKYGKETNGTVHFYKKGEAVKDSDESIIKVLNKWVFSKREVSNAIQYRRENRLSTKGYDKLSHMIYLSEIDCQSKSERMIYLYLYDQDGKALYSHSYKTPEWNTIQLYSNGEALFKAVCR